MRLFSFLRRKQSTIQPAQIRFLCTRRCRSQFSLQARFLETGRDEAGWVEVKVDHPGTQLWLVDM